MTANAPVCDFVQFLISERCDRSLDADEAVLVVGHVAGCEACREFDETLSSLSACFAPSDAGPTASEVEESEGRVARVVACAVAAACLLGLTVYLYVTCVACGDPVGPAACTSSESRRDERSDPQQPIARTGPIAGAGWGSMPPGPRTKPVRPTPTDDGLVARADAVAERLGFADYASASVRSTAPATAAADRARAVRVLVDAPASVAGRDLVAALDWADGAIERRVWSRLASPSFGAVVDDALRRRALARFQDPRGAAPTRHAVGMFIERHGDAADVPVLLRVFDAERNPLIRRAAIRAVGALGDESHAAAVRARCNESTPPRMRGELIRTYGKLSADPAWLIGLATTDGAPRDAAAALDALALRQSVGSLRLDATVRAAIRMAIRTATGARQTRLIGLLAQDYAEPRRGRLLLDVASQVAPDQLRTHVRRMGIGGNEAAVPYLRERLRSNRVDIVAAAAGALRDIGDVARSALGDVMAAHDVARKRDPAHDEPVTRTLAGTRLRLGDSSVRATIASWLTRGGLPAREAIGFLAPDAQSADGIALLIERRADASDAIRFEIARRLVGVGVPAAQLEAVRTWRRDERAAWVAFALSFASPELEPARARAALVRLAREAGAPKAEDFARSAEVPSIDDLITLLDADPARAKRAIQKAITRLTPSNPGATRLGG